MEKLVFLITFICVTVYHSYSQDINSTALTKIFLDTIQKEAYLTKNVNWDSIRPIFINKAKNIQTQEELLNHFKSFLKILNDGHSNISFLESEHSSDDNFLELMMKMTDESAGLPPKNFQHRIIDNQYAYILVPPVSYEHLKYIDTLKRQLIELDHQNPKGWIIDLTENSGGMNHPMIWHFASLVDTTPTYSYISASGYEVKNSPILTFEDRESEKIFKSIGLDINVIPPIELKNKDIPIVILTSQRTASAGEFFLAHFKGQRNVKVIGQTTNGSTTTNQAIDIGKNFQLYLSVSVLKDRTGKVYEVGEGIRPDILFSLDMTGIKTTDQLLKLIQSNKNLYIDKAKEYLAKIAGQY